MCIFREGNKDKTKEYSRQHYLGNKEKINERIKKYRFEDRERWKKYRHEHYLNNRDKSIEYAIERRGALRKQCPKWADKDKIKEIYKEAQELTELFGIQFHVDHVVPLNGKLVMGLHVPNNLQILTAKENLEKGNKFEIGGESLPPYN